MRLLWLLRAPPVGGVREALSGARRTEALEAAAGLLPAVQALEGRGDLDETM